MVAGWATNAITARELARPPEVLGVAPVSLADAANVRSLYHVRGPAGQTVALKLRAIGVVNDFSVEGLPSGLTVNVATGFIQGNLPAAGSHEITLKATNVYGTSPPFTLYLVAE